MSPSVCAYRAGDDGVGAAYAVGIAVGFRIDVDDLRGKTGAPIAAGNAVICRPRRERGYAG